MALASELWGEYLHRVLPRPLTRESWQAFVTMWLRGPLDIEAQQVKNNSVEVEFCEYPLNGDQRPPEDIALSYLQSWVRQDDEKIAFLGGNRPSEVLSDIGGCFVKKRGEACGKEQSLEATHGLFFLDKGVQVRRNDGKIENFPTLQEMVVFGGWSAD